MGFRHECFLVNLLHIFRTSFPKNTSGWLLLILVSHAVGLLSLLLKNVSEKSINKKIELLYKIVHCVKSVLIRNFFWSDLLPKSPYSVQIQGNTDQKKLRVWTLSRSEYFFSNKRKNLRNLSPFRNDVPIRFRAFHILGLGAERNTEIMKTVRTFVSKRLNLSSVDLNIQSKQFITN